MPRLIAAFICVICLSVAAFAADPPAPSVDKVKLKKAKQEFAAQQQSKKNSQHIQKKWAKSQKKGYNKLAKAGRKSPKKSKPATNTRVVSRTSVKR